MQFLKKFKKSENFTKAKDKNKKVFTLIVAPNYDGKTHSFTMSAFLLRNLLLGCCVFVFAAFLLLISYVGISANYKESKQDMAKLKSINKELQQQLNEMNELAKNVEEQLLYLNLLETRINTLIQENEGEETSKSPEMNEINANLEMVQARVASSAAAVGLSSAVYFQESDPITTYDLSETLYRINTVLSSLNIDVESETNKVEEVEEVIDSKNDYQECYPDFFPLISGSPYAISDYFGYRTSPSVGFHAAIDFSAAYGTGVMATGRGTVTRASFAGDLGYYIEIDHGYGLATGYAHLSEILVEVGQHVEKGDLIGRVGSTGYSTGNHLHYITMEDGVKVNPLKYLPL